MNHEHSKLNRVRPALREATQRWLYDPNVTLIDYGWPEREGQLVEEELAIRIHVRRKYPEGPQLEAAIKQGMTSDTIPDSIAGIPIDVPQGRFALHQWGRWGGWRRGSTASQRACRADPMQGGISISNARQNGYATLGGLVRDRTSGAAMILSNWHVINGDWFARPGQQIYQPGRGDGGTRADAVASLTRDALLSHNLDASVATLTGSRNLTNRQLGVGTVTGVGRFTLGMEVVKSGRRTGITLGRVTNAIPGMARLWYAGVYVVIVNVITISQRQAFEEVSAGGDSGSWWLDTVNRQAIGLHFAGQNCPEQALAIDMQSVLDALGVDIVTSN